MIGVGFHYYVAFLVVFLAGFYLLIDAPDLIQKVIGVNLLQVSAFLLLVTTGYVEGADPPLLYLEGPHANPLPHVLVLTAIVVGVSLTTLGLALVVRLEREFGTTDVDEIERQLALEHATGIPGDEGEPSRGDDPGEAAGSSERTEAGRTEGTGEASR
ncbi:MAG: cation:proton antiporter subunit C [Haloferacaceae archaeon]